jgi:[glutamine synthetase] adenylyltransferase / [glutamine synthetase]-adenylyl-L-tyrosine phosphorylase
MAGKTAPPPFSTDRSLADEHRARLDARYFERFTQAEIQRHIEAVASLGPERPVTLLVESLPGPGDERGCACTVVAFDHPGAFSAIAGILSALGFDIKAGDIFTWQPPSRSSPRDPGLRRRRIVDQFSGVVAPDQWDASWSDKLRGRLEEVFGLLEAGGDAAARARRIVNEMAAGALGRIAPASATTLYPVQIDVRAAGGRTRMRVISQDTPFFLFTFSTALTLQEVSIEHVTIRTDGGRIEDDFEFVDARGKPIEEPDRIDRIKLSVLLTKQFTSFLGSAPDPLAALVRFEHLVKDVLAMPQQGRWVQLLSDQGVLRDLAHILGASTFLWEDFVRLQYEELLPMLAPHLGSARFSEPLEEIPERLHAALSGARDTPEFERGLNEFKDREIYLFDLDHILTARRGTEGMPGDAGAPSHQEAFESDFLLLSRRLTALAEAVVEEAAAHAYRTISERFGEPRTVAALPVRFAILGLGKMGGAALGYASDIEILVVYSDSGSTAGPQKIENREFFDAMIRELLRLVHAKREGIFHIDLRLRPYGAAGPLGCSLESFCTYYARGGPAHSYERLSLVRLRAVGGDRDFASQVERLRDEMVYSAESINLVELRELRARQVQEKTEPGHLNAKFSPGALVDLEYAVQILQVMHGASERRLRTPRIHEALEALASIGVVEKGDAAELAAAYRFFRRLINGLRMLRGSARDLVLPGLDSDEYLHLARRMGYAADPEITPAQKLHLDFETSTAGVRAFVERHFGRDSLPGAPVVTVADLILSDAIPPDLAERTLRGRGFHEPARALLNLRHIRGEAERRTLFARLAILACDTLSRRPDPDMALNNWERFLHALPDPQAHLREMLSQPMRLEILLSIFSASQFLADTLVRDPTLLDFIGRSEVIHAHKSGTDVVGALGAISDRSAGRDEWRDALRRYRRNEILRIGARDICLGVPTQRIMEEISDLADGIIEAALRRIRAEARARAGTDGVEGFCIIAFGKLGARELNYSSDIDLLGLCTAEDSSNPEEFGTRLMAELRADLSTHTVEGNAYRVDLRLRPYGSSGQLVFTPRALQDYYARHAALWELQALLKARPIAGDLEVGRAFLDSVRPLLIARHDPAEVMMTIDRLRKDAVRSLARSILTTTDIKTGLGGLRDVEFVVQGLQLINAHARPELLGGGTLPALAAMAQARILPPETAEQLSQDYLFLRRVEHFLQIYEDRQTHSLPQDPAQLRALARLMLGGGASSDQLLRALADRFERIRSISQDIMRPSGAAALSAAARPPRSRAR